MRDENVCSERRSLIASFDTPSNKKKKMSEIGSIITMERALVDENNFFRIKQKY